VGGVQRKSVATQQLRVAVWAPKEYRLVGTPAPYDVITHNTFLQTLFKQERQISQQELDSWIGTSSNGVFDFPVEGVGTLYSSLGPQSELRVRWWHLPFLTWICCGTLIAIALLLRWTSWENKLTLVILGLAGSAIMAVCDYELTRYLLVASFWGAVAMFAIWILHELFGRTTNRRSVPGPHDGPPPAVIPPPGVFDSVTLGLPK
jgi:hypothetical protein